MDTEEEEIRSGIIEIIQAFRLLTFVSIGKELKDEIVFEEWRKIFEVELKFVSIKRKEKKIKVI